MKKDLSITQSNLLIYVNQDGRINIDIRNILTEGELEPEAVIKDFLITDRGETNLPTKKN